MALTIDQKNNEEIAQSVRFGNTSQPTASLATSATPNQIQRTGFTVDIPESIPSNSLVDGGSYADLRNKRNQMESSQIANQQFDTDLSNLTSRINSPFAGTPISNPDEFINRLLLNRPTDTQTELDQSRQNQADSFRDFSTDYQETGKQAREEFGIAGLQESLADTRTRIAERTTKLREDLRKFETNAESRGVAREFVQSEKQKIQADAVAELADLAIIESAQLGNLQQAQEDIDSILNEKMRAFELENMAIEQEIKRLESIDTRESNIRSEQLQVALNERQRREEKLIAEEKQRLQIMAESAANGADSATLNAIRNSTSVAEATVLAGPWIGRLDRLKTLSIINERISGGNQYDSPSGPIEMPSFEEWANENGGRVWQVGGTEAEMVELRNQYEAEVEVATRANALTKISPLAQEILKNPKGYFDLTPTKRGQILEELAKAGIDTAQIQEGKKQKLSATQTDDLVQAQLARRNVVELYELLKSVPGTGPIAGRLKALDPYDPTISAIKAQINRTVPGLARGIFKEVGVLTDTDINRYSNTLANLQFTDEQIEQLHNDTLSLINDSIGITTSTYSDLGYDLGTFEFDDTNSKTSEDGLSDDEAFAEYEKVIKENQ